ncbi:MAG: copper amine oxidase N-terminal domain-containing protein, partial [Candidatus Omnitrophica bacterium]|nr:copper amine oxidase N-terminal domain-containing protein [Candidatus Omnitrophota bacterium]
MRLYIMIILLAAGVNITGAGHAFLIKGPEKMLDATAYKIRGVEYLPLTLICDAYGIDWKWDPSSRTADLTKGNALVRFRAGEYKVYINGVITVEEKPTLIHMGAICVPADFLKTVFNRFFSARPAEAIPQAAQGGFIPRPQAPSYNKIRK